MAFLCLGRDIRFCRYARRGRHMSHARQLCRAFSLVELLVAISIVSLLVAIGIPSLARVRSNAAEATCLENLRQLTMASTAYATEDASTLLLPAHPISDVNELHDEGFFDYGGGTGAENIWSGARWGKQSSRRAETRPLNRTLFGQVGANADYSLFRCAADFGLPPREYVGAGDYWDGAMENQPMHVSVGTSYWGNAYRGIGSTGTDQAKRFWSVSVFLRPAFRVPSPSETVLYGEAIAWEQIALTGNAGGGAAFMLRGTESWHRGGRFNLSFADGHARTLRLLSGFLHQGSEPGNSPLALLQIRGAGFRFDCRPDALIVDKPE